MPFDFATIAAPFRMQPGLRRVAPGATQLSPNRLGSAHLAAKLSVLTRHADQALLTAPGFDSGPVLHALMRQATVEHPNDFTWDGAQRWAAHRLGWSLDGDEPRPGGGPPEIGECLFALPRTQRLPGLLSLAFEEDFAAIDGDTTRVGWLAVCLPSHWSPAAKLGRHFAEIHAAVADNATLIKASGHLTRLVTGAERWERFVWTITPRPGLDAHPQRTGPGRWPIQASTDRLAETAFFRSEHQTFIPVSAAPRQAAFTIRVEVQPLADIVDRSERACQLHDALASMSAAVLAYRGLTDARDRLLHWLADRAR